jgi:hypothetical protein
MRYALEALLKTPTSFFEFQLRYQVVERENTNAVPSTCLDVSPEWVEAKVVMY